MAAVPHLEVVELAGLVAIRQGTPEPDVDEAWWVFPHTKGSLRQPAVRTGHAQSHLDQFARMSPEEQDRHLVEEHHVPTGLVRGYRREDHGRLVQVGGYGRLSEAERLHNGMHTDSGKLSLPRRFGLTGAPMDTPHLDKVLALVSQESIDEVARVSHAYPDGVHTREQLARLEPGRRGEPGGRTRDYTRRERGREERVSGHIERLREMAGPHAQAGGTYARAADDLERGLDHGAGGEIRGHIEKAYAAHQAGQHSLARTHLINARNKATYSGAVPGLRTAIRAAISHQGNLSTGEPLPSMRHVQNLASRNEPLGWNPAF